MTCDYSFPTGGSYDVKLTVADNDGGVSSATQTLSVTQVLTVDFYAGMGFGAVPLTTF